MYPEFAKIATEESLPEIASVSTSIAVAERQHEKRFLDEEDIQDICIQTLLLIMKGQAELKARKDLSHKFRC